MAGISASDGNGSLEKAIGRALADGGLGVDWPLALMSLSRDLICVCRGGGEGIVYINDAGLAMLGADDTATVRGRPFASFLHDNYRAGFEMGMDLLAEEGETFPVKLMTLDGAVRDVEVRVAGIALEDGTGYLITAHDITNRLRTANRILGSERRYRKLVDNALDLILVADDGGIRFVNEAGVEILKAGSADDIVGRQVWEFMTPEYEAVFADGVAPILEEADSVLPVRVLCLDGTIKDMEMAFVELADDQPGYMVEGRDITGHNKAVAALRRMNENLERLVDERTKELRHEINERKKAEEVIRHQATYDALTGLPNRALFFERLHEEVSQAKREERRLSLMFIDLDGFKAINDTLGHDAGDLLLKETAARLKHAVRDSDTVARLAGDEFTVILPHHVENFDCATTADRILEALAEPFDLDGQEGHVSGSIGIAVLPDDAEDHETLIKNADAAMYRAKHKGKANYQYYTASLSKEAEDRMALSDALGAALEANEFTLVYQPTVGLKDGRVWGLEALLRWESAAFGTVATSKFIPVLERGGMVNDVGEWIIRTACDGYRGWTRGGADGHDLRVSLNISARQLRYPGFVDTLGEIVAAAGLSGSSVMLEIKEATVLANADEARKILGRIRELGVTVILDDFGTGYGAMNALRDMPIDAIKIDRSVIARIADSDRERKAVAAMVAIAHSFDRKVVAEGVETTDQLGHLREMGCDAAQGYLISEPLDGHRVPAFLDGFALPG